MMFPDVRKTLMLFCWSRGKISQLFDYNKNRQTFPGLPVSFVNATDIYFMTVNFRVMALSPLINRAV